VPSVKEVHGAKAVGAVDVGVQLQHVLARAHGELCGAGRE